MSLDRLYNIAVSYSQRYLVSEAKLIEYLSRKIHLATTNDAERGKLLSQVPSIASKLARLGLVNDKQAASAKLRSTLRSGYAPRLASSLAALKAKVDIDVSNEMLPETLKESFPDLEGGWEEESNKGEFFARTALSRSRRGPFRISDRNKKTDQRDIAWLRRRGYRYEDICKAMDLEPDDLF